MKNRSKTLALRSLAALGALAVAGQAAAQALARTQLEAAAGAGAAAVAPAAGAPVSHQRPGHGGWRHDEDGRQEAIRSCMRADFDSDKKACVQAANAARYFDPAAARACGDMDFGSNIAKCLNAIADKSYVPEEVTLCSENSFDSGKIDCFRSGGRGHEARPPYYPRPDIDSYILRRLRQIRSDLEYGNIPRALAGLGELMMFVEEGMNGPRRDPRFP